MENNSNIDLVILAGGSSSRTKLDKPKSLLELSGETLLERSLSKCASLNPRSISVVIGEHSKEHINQINQICEPYKKNHKKTALIITKQKRPNGSADALDTALNAHRSFRIGSSGIVVSINVDVPLLKRTDIIQAIKLAQKKKFVLVGFRAPDPTGYGRMITDKDGMLVDIIEEREADAKQKDINTVFAGALCCPKEWLRLHMPSLTISAKTHEKYLTAVVAIAHERKVPCVPYIINDHQSLQGINDLSELALCEKILRNEQATAQMNKGVIINDPDRFDLRGKLTAAPGVNIDVNCVFTGEVKLAAGVKVGVGAVITDCNIGENTEIKPYSVISGCNIGKDCQIGPFAHIRATSQLGDKVKIGNFVEVKNSKIGTGTKSSHLAYMGDAKIGEDCNIGAGSITCNYDGDAKHETTIEDGVFVGSNVQLIAPIKIGKGAFLAAGSVINQDVKAGSRAIARTRQFLLPEKPEGVGEAKPTTPKKKK